MLLGLYQRLTITSSCLFWYETIKSTFHPLCAFSHASSNLQDSLSFPRNRQKPLLSSHFHSITFHHTSQRFGNFCNLSFSPFFFQRYPKAQRSLLRFQLHSLNLQDRYLLDSLALNFVLMLSLLEFLRFLSFLGFPSFPSFPSFNSFLVTLRFLDLLNPLALFEFLAIAVVTILFFVQPITLTPETFYLQWLIRFLLVALI